jgi:spermidine synthase
MATVSVTDPTLATAPVRRSLLLFYVIFFLSGVSALTFETLWFRQAGLALGNSVWAGSMVLASFMAGLALGNLVAGRFGHRCSRPILMYGILEIIIGICGVALVVFYPSFNSFLVPVLRPLIDQPLIINPIRLGVGFVSMLPATVAMGATLPLMVKGLRSRDDRFGDMLGRLYACNTLGAMAGAICCEMLLISMFGIRGTGIVAGLLNLTVGVAAIRMSRSFSTSDDDGPATISLADRRPLNRYSIRLLIAASLSGGALLALEVIWFRFLLLFNFGTSQVFAVMLAVVLGGIGAGGLVASRWVRKHRASKTLPYVAIASGLMATLTYAIPALAVVLLKFDFQTDHSGLTTLLHSLVVMLPVSVLSGVLFTLTGQALHDENGSDTKSAGYLTLFNTFGAMLGALIAGFVLLPRCGIEVSFLLLSAVYALVAALTLRIDLSYSRISQVTLAAGGALLVLLVGLFPRGYVDNAVFLSVSGASPDSRTRVVAIREGITDTIMYSQYEWMGHPLYHRLITNSHSMSGTTPEAWQYMKQYVYLPAAIHPKLEKACLISYGCGVTGKALTDNKELKQIDIVDISKDILELNSVVYPEPADQPLRDPRVRVFIEDGRFFLLTTDQQYDLITSEPPPPKGANVVNLYTQEYFQLIHDRLAAGGITSYWLPHHSLAEGDARTIVRAFCEVFEDSSLWLGSGENWLLLGVKDGHQKVSADRFREQWSDPVVGPVIRASGFETPEQFGAYFICGRDEMLELTKDTLPLVDNYPHRLSPSSSARHGESRYLELMDAETSRQRFLASDHIRRLWPDELLESTSKYFETRNLIHDLWAPRDVRVSASPPGSLPAMHELLTKTELETALLWSLNSGYRDQLAAEQIVKEGRANLWVTEKIGHRHLSRREYNEAIAHYSKALEKMPPGSLEYQMAVVRHAYALCQTGQFEAAQRVLVERLGKSQVDDFVTNDLVFLESEFGLTSPVEAPEVPLKSLTAVK